MRAGDVYFIKVLTEDKCTYERMTCEKDVTFTFGVTEDNTATDDTSSGVRVCRLKWNDAMRVH